MGISLVFLIVFISPWSRKPEESATEKRTLPANATQTDSHSAKREPRPGENPVNSPPAHLFPAQTNSVEETIALLEELGTRDDSESFQKIVSQLADANPEIRNAALEATMQFGNRDAIPMLKELAAKTHDAREKVEILDAIKFLGLPSLSELRQERRVHSRPNVAPK